MAESKMSKKLTNDQLEIILNTDHIRKHLIKAGLINRRGEIIPKNETRRHSRGRYTSNNKRNYSTSRRHQLITASPKRPTENIIEDLKRQDRPRSPDYNSNDRRLKSASTAQSKPTNKSQTSTRFSSSNQSTCAQNVLLRRAVSPKIIPASDRCLVKMMYFGPEINIEYERNWFEPNGDEIIIMQQHCGGENLLVFKGSLKPNETFLFESRRHADYPFALAIYLNGVINNRLSICCEYRCKEFMRIGGKRGLFAIINIDKGRPCRRCRFEQRMKKLTEAEAKLSKKTNEPGHEKLNETHTSTSNSTEADAKNLESTSGRTPNSNTTLVRQSNPELAASPTNDSKITSTRVSSAKQKEPYISSMEPTVPSTTNSKPIEIRTSSPKSLESGTSSSKPIVDHTTSSKKIAARISSPEEIESNTSSRESPTNRIINSKISVPRMSSPETVDSDTSISKPTVSRTAGSTKTTEARVLSPEQIQSDASSPEPIIYRTKNSKPTDEIRTSSPTERQKSPPSIGIRSTIPSNHQPRATSSPNSYASDFEEPEEKHRSPLTTPRENDPINVSSSNSPSTKPYNQHRAPSILSDTDSDEEIAKISDNSHDDFEQAVVKSNRRRSTED